MLSGIKKFLCLLIVICFATSLFACNQVGKQNIYDAQIHAKMYDLYMKNFELHASLDCEMFVNFSYVGKRESQYGSWGVLENLSDIHAENLKQIAPKYQAILDANKKH